MWMVAFHELSCTTISDPFPAHPKVAEREALAVSARDAAGVSEFRISGP